MIINKNKLIKISALVKHIFDITLKRIPSETNLRTHVTFNYTLLLYGARQLVVAQIYVLQLWWAMI